MSQSLQPLSILVLATFASCASIMVPKTTQAEITSPEPVVFQTSTGLTGTTPAKVCVPTGAAVTIQWTNPDGSNGVYVSVPNRMSLWVLGNVVVGLPGFLVDALKTTNRLHRESIHLPVVTSPLAPTGLGARRSGDRPGPGASDSAVPLPSNPTSNLP